MTGSIFHDQAVLFVAPAEPGLVRVRVTVYQGDIERSGEALITVTHELLPQVGTTMVESSGLPALSSRLGAAGTVIGSFGMKSEP